MEKNYNRLYLKYKNKYLKLKKSMEGGLLVTSTKYNECSKDKLYFKPACGNEYPCLNNDTKCYNKNNDVSNNSIPKKLVDEIFSTDGKPVIIKTNSFVLGFFS